MFSFGSILDQKEISIVYFQTSVSVNINLFNVNNRNFRKMCEICSKLTIQTIERRQ